MPVILRLIALSLAGFVISSPIERRGTIASDKIVALPSALPPGAVGIIYKAYQPYLHVVNGCVPFPAVDVDGNTNAGLNPTGNSNGGCSSSTGQIYVRGQSYNNYYGLMYSWYMPKDEPSDGLGHRHDWEGVIIWLSNATPTTAGNILAVCPSAHGGWDCSTDGFTLSGTGALINYESIWPIDHSCGLTTTRGGQQPMVAWESLSVVEQDALETTDFGSAIVPFIPAHFTNNLAAATF